MRTKPAGLVSSARVYVLYDGECGICVPTVRALQRIDSAKRYTFATSQSLTNEQLRQFGVSRERVDRALTVVTEKRILQGAIALNYLLWFYMPYKLMVCAGIIVPIIGIVEILTYRLVASNRARISGALGLTVCSIETRTS